MIQWLALSDARLGFTAAGGATRWVLDGIDLRLARGDSLSLLGSSGSGKTVLARLLIGLAPLAAEFGGELSWAGDDGQGETPLAASRDGALSPALAAEWGRSIAYVPQGGVRNLNPALTVGAHLSRARRRAGAVSDRPADLALLAEVGFSDPPRVWTRLPRALSGGMARRVLLALALAGAPDVVVMDEPTTGLDSARREQIVELIEAARSRHGFGLLTVTHEVGDASRLAPLGHVLDGGKIVETLELAPGQVPRAPRHEAARSLVDAWQWRGWESR